MAQMPPAESGPEMRTETWRNRGSTRPAFLNNGDLMAAVYARSAFEWKLKNVCQDRGIEIKYKKDHKEISADDLWQGIVARQRKRDELKKTKPATPDFITPQLEKRVDAMRSNVLNQLSHNGAPDLKADEVRDAINTIRAFHSHGFPNVS
jgi:hypothetical protein